MFFCLPQTFNPHITLAYNSGVDRENMSGDFIQIADTLKSIKPDRTYSFAASNIALVQLGYSGNVEKVLKQFPLMRLVEPLEHK